MSQLKITTIQADLKWEAPAANLAMFEGYFEKMPTDTEIVILPEMFSTGFSMRPEVLAESMTGQAMNWLKEKAAKYDTIITGSLVIEAGGKYYNRLIWQRPDGTFEQYDKHKLFKMAGEDEHYTAGTQKLIVEHKGFKICSLICYDLRFPVWARNVEDYDILIYVANWPIMRRVHWRVLLQARAIENQCFTIGVNRCGTDGNGFEYSGDTAIFAPYGEEVYHVEHKTEMATHTILKSEVERIREKIPYLKDREVFELK